MKKEGKGRAAELLHLTVRILTLPPIVIGVTLVMLYARSAERGSELLLSEIFLLLIPLAAYPLREPFRIGAERREGQRSTALVYGVW